HSLEEMDTGSVRRLRTSWSGITFGPQSPSSRTSPGPSVLLHGRHWSYPVSHAVVSRGAAGRAAGGLLDDGAAGFSFPHAIESTRRSVKRVHVRRPNSKEKFVT